MVHIKSQQLCCIVVIYLPLRLLHFPFLFGPNVGNHSLGSELLTALPTLCGPAGVWRSRQMNWKKKTTQINNFRASGLILEGQGWSQTLLTGCLSITQGDGPGLTCRSRPRTGPALASGGKMEDYWDHRKIPSLCTSCPSDADICSVAAFQHKF